MPLAAAAITTTATPSRASSSHQQRRRTRRSVVNNNFHFSSSPSDERNARENGSPKRSYSLKSNSSSSCFSSPSMTFLLSVTICNGLLIYILVQVWLSYKISLSFPPTTPQLFESLSSFVAWNKNNNNNNDDDNIIASSSKLKFRNKVYRQNENKPHQQPPPPIVVVGLPKAGTSSLFVFFQCYSSFRLNVQHWYCCGPQKFAQRGMTPESVLMADCMRYNLQEQLPILDGCGEYDVYTEINGPKRLVLNGGGGSKNKKDKQKLPKTKRDSGIFLPQRYHLQELHHWNPNATWILNLRPVRDWVHSALHLKQTKGAPSLVQQFAEEMDIQDDTQPLKNIFGPHYNRSILKYLTMNQSTTFLEYFYNSHIDIVREFCRQHHHRLVEVNITDDNAGVNLIKALGWENYLSLSFDTTRKYDDSNAGNDNNTMKAISCWGRHNARDKPQR